MFKDKIHVVWKVTTGFEAIVKAGSRWLSKEITDEKLSCVTKFTLTKVLSYFSIAFGNERGPPPLARGNSDPPLCGSNGYLRTWVLDDNRRYIR